MVEGRRRRAGDIGRDHIEKPRPWLRPCWRCLLLGALVFDAFDCRAVLAQRPAELRREASQGLRCPRPAPCARGRASPPPPDAGSPSPAGPRPWISTPGGAPGIRTGRHAPWRRPRRSPRQSFGSSRDRSARSLPGLAPLASETVPAFSGSSSATRASSARPSAPPRRLRAPAGPARSAPRSSSSIRRSSSGPKPREPR